MFVLHCGTGIKKKRKSCLLHKQILFNVYNKLAGGKGQEISSPSAKREEADENNATEATTDSFPVFLLSRSCWESERGRRSHSEYLTVSLDDRSGEASQLIFIHYLGNLNISHISHPPSLVCFPSWALCSAPRRIRKVVQLPGQEGRPWCEQWSVAAVGPGRYEESFPCY